MNTCPNPNHPQFKKMVEELGSNLAYYYYDKAGYMLADEEIEELKEKYYKDKIKPSVQVKPGVQELFDSNPELAAAFYESLGFKNKFDVILPIGTSGSGKSTFIKSLPQENLVVIEPDTMRVEFTGDMNNKSKDKEIYIEAANRAIKAIKAGKQVVFDTTNLTKDKRLPFIEAIKKVIPTANIQYKLMELNPELAKQRIKAQISRGENRANVSDETIDRHAESYKQMLEDIKSEPISNFEITPQQKQQAQQIYSQYLESLNKPNTNPILQGNQEEQVKKFAELQERLNNKEFIEGAKNAFESSEGLRSFGTQEQYNDYIARVSLGIIKNPSSGEYNYESKLKDVVYHGTDNKDVKFYKNNTEGFFSKVKGGTPNAIFFSKDKAPKDSVYTRAFTLSVLLDLKKPFSRDDKGDRDSYPENYKTTINNAENNGFDGVEILNTHDNFDTDVFVVFDPEQIHILGSKQDIEGFKNFVNTQESTEFTKGETVNLNRTSSDFNKEHEFYRIIVGDESFKDIVDNNVIRTNYYSKPLNSSSTVIDLTNRPTLFPSFSKGSADMMYAKSNENHYIIVSTDPSIKPSTKGRHGKGTTMFPTDDSGNTLSELGTDFVKVYKYNSNGVYTLVYENGKEIINTQESTNKPDYQYLQEQQVDFNNVEDKLQNILENKLKELYPEIELNISNNPIWEKGDNIVNQEDYNNRINYTLKSVELLQSQKANEVFKKGNKNNWSLDKILSELSVPKEQKQLIFDVLKDMSYYDEIPFNEQIALELASKYSYTVEINTSNSKTENIKQIHATSFEVDGMDYTAAFGSWFKNEGMIKISHSEYKEALEKYNKSDIEEKPTQYYSDLTVLGGINYTEQEIATPAIIPSIKGHAKFSTDKGIGWFRSDEQTKSNTSKVSLSNKFAHIYNINYNGQIIGTIELPTDLGSDSIAIGDVNIKPEFRGKGLGVETYKAAIKMLDKPLESFMATDEANRVWNSLIKQGLAKKTETGFISVKSNKDTKTRRILEVQSDLFQKGRDKSELVQDKPENSGWHGIIPATTRDGKDNQFLQLLNKDNNWVTFFVKSIIQDSAKKGYEKVLFPRLDTIIQIESENKFKTYKEAEEHYKNESWRLEDEKLRKTLKEYQQEFEDRKVLKKDTKEIEQTIINQKEKIRSHQPTLLNTANFYEYELANRLDDIVGGNKNDRGKGIWALNQITDEYGNTWNEITVNQARDLSNVLLQKNETNNIIGQANIKAMTVLIDNRNKKSDTLPHEYAHHYIAWFRNTPIVQEAIKKWGSEEKLVQAIGEQVVKQKGLAYNWWVKFSNWIKSIFNNLDAATKEELLAVLTEGFLTRQDLNSTEQKTFDRVDKSNLKDSTNIFYQKVNQARQNAESTEFTKGETDSIDKALSKISNVQEETKGLPLKQKMTVVAEKKSIFQRFINTFNKLKTVEKQDKMALKMLESKEFANLETLSFEVQLEFIQELLKSKDITEETRDKLNTLKDNQEYIKFYIRSLQVDYKYKNSLHSHFMSGILGFQASAILAVSTVMFSDLPSTLSIPILFGGVLGGAVLGLSIAVHSRNKSLKTLSNSSDLSNIVDNLNIKSNYNSIKPQLDNLNITEEQYNNLTQQEKDKLKSCYL